MKNFLESHPLATWIMFLFGIMTFAGIMVASVQMGRAENCLKAAELYRSAATSLADETQRYLDDPYTIPDLENVADDFRDAERLECK